MAGRTITRADLINAVCQELDIPRVEGGDIIDQIIEEIVSALERGESVRLSSFGTFEVRSKNARMGRNPKTGQEVPIEPRHVVTFRSSNVLKRHINPPKV